MPPKKKRLVVETTGMEIDKDGSSSSSWSASECVARKDELTKRWISQLDDLESSSSSAIDASVTLLKLKSLQRGLLARALETHEVLRGQAIRRDQQELQLENLLYEQRIHEESLQRSESAATTAAAGIAKLVKGMDASKENQNDDDISTILQAFLGAEYTDPAQRPAIVAKLNTEVFTRKDLEATLHRLSQECQSTRATLAARQKLLHDLPQKLADLEKASLPLQKFCEKLSASSRLGTTKRQSRLRLARALPGALYTLFHQLQSCLDGIAAAASKTNTTNNNDEEPLPTIEIIESSASSAVVLKIPVPIVSSGGVLGYKPKKRASICFEYDAACDLILATCGNDYDMGQVVINELFPGDKGEYTTVTTTARGRAYQWCNYLGGLHVAPADQTAARRHSSATVITKALMRRVRATATLSWILHALSRKPRFAEFPKHDAVGVDEDDHPDVQLSSWTSVATNENNNDQPQHHSNNNIVVYNAVLERKNNKTERLTASVSINLARYPSVIPRWKILREDDDEEQSQSLDSLPLYEEGLARLEREVNRSVDRLVCSTNQTTYDWVLGQQLIEIAKGWK